MPLLGVPGRTAVGHVRPRDRRDGNRDRSGPHPGYGPQGRPLADGALRAARLVHHGGLRRSPHRGLHGRGHRDLHAMAAVFLLVLNASAGTSQYSLDAWLERRWAVTAGGRPARSPRRPLRRARPEAQHVPNARGPAAWPGGGLPQPPSGRGLGVGNPTGGRAGAGRVLAPGAKTCTGGGATLGRLLWCGPHDAAGLRRSRPRAGGVCSP